jgi:transcriptional regulator with XRE-family HTH domain
VDDQRIGRIARMLRRRKGWRQVELAVDAGCSQSLISLFERGHLESLSVRVMREILGALDAGLVLEVRWRGAAADRLLDEAHAALVAETAARLRHLGWDVQLEVTYSQFGERGSFDILAWHPISRTVLAVEVKTEMPSLEETLRKLDEKARLAATVGRERFGWQARSAGRLLVLPSTSTMRASLGRHASIVENALPLQGAELRRWLARPIAGAAGVWFVSNTNRSSRKSAGTAHERVRRPKPNALPPPLLSRRRSERVATYDHPDS